MSKIYKKLSSDFTVLSNDIFRHGLSLKAIGLYVYLINKPDYWSFSVVGTSKQLKEGRDSIRNAIYELETAGFLSRKQSKTDKGRFTGSDWWIADKPLPKEPMTENTSPENSTQVNTNQVNTKEVNTISSNEEMSEEISDFELPTCEEAANNLEKLSDLARATTGVPAVLPDVEPESDAAKSIQLMAIVSAREDKERQKRILTIETKQAILYFAERFQDKEKKPYVITWGVETKLMKPAIEKLRLEGVKKLIVRFFSLRGELRDKFGARTIKNFTWKINDLSDTNYNSSRSY